MPLLQHLKNFALSYLDYIYDRSRFLKYSQTRRKKIPNEQCLQARIMALAHGIEKGLSLAKTKPGFGEDKIHDLITYLNIYDKAKLPRDNIAYQMALNVIEEYRKFHTAIGVNVDKNIDFINDTCFREAIIRLPSIMEYDRKDLLSACNDSYEYFVKKRHSIRVYSKEPVTEVQIKKAVEIALKTPSVCNRQAYRLYYTIENTIIRELMLQQNGNRGFGPEAPAAMVVTCDLSAFFNTNERNQAYIDGGLFSMSILYALHYLGLGACALNWSVSYRQDRKLRNLLNIANEENIIMLICFGHLPEKIKVPSSQRYPVNKIMCKLKMKR